MAEDTDPTTIADIRESALGGKGIGARSPCSATESRASKLLKDSIAVAWFRDDTFGRNLLVSAAPAKVEMAEVISATDLM